MKFTRAGKLCLFTATIWPVVHMLIFMALVLVMMFVMIVYGGCAPHGDHTVRGEHSQERPSGSRHGGNNIPFESLSPSARAAVVGAGLFFIALFASHMLTILLLIGLPVFYIHYLYRYSGVESDGVKVAWIVLLIFCGFIAAPVFYFKYIHPLPLEPRAA